MSAAFENPSGIMAAGGFDGDSLAAVLIALGDIDVEAIDMSGVSTDDDSDSEPPELEMDADDHSFEELEGEARWLPALKKLGETEQVDYDRAARRERVVSVLMIMPNGGFACLSREASRGDLACGRSYQLGGVYVDSARLLMCHQRLAWGKVMHLRLAGGDNVAYALPEDLVGAIASHLDYVYGTHLTFEVTHQLCDIGCERYACLYRTRARQESRILPIIRSLSLPTGWVPDSMEPWDAVRSEPMWCCQPTEFIRSHFSREEITQRMTVQRDARPE